MTHIILLLYLLAGLCGIGSMIFLITKYGNKGAYFKAYLGVHSSYTMLMLAALVVLYLRVNVIKSPMIMSVFVAVILLGQGVLCLALCQFSFALHKGSRKGRVFWNIIPFLYGVLALLHILLRKSSFALYPVISGVFLFIVITIWFTRRNSRIETGQTKEEGRVWIYFLLFTLLIIIIEITLKIYTGFLGDYSLNIPIIFLCWIFLSVSQFRKKLDLNKNWSEISSEKILKYQLTAREVEICRAIFRGESNKEIASKLNLSFSTVKNHIYNIYKKTGAESRVDLFNLLK